MKMIHIIISKIEELIADLISSGKIIFMSGGSSGRRKAVKKP
jgi:N-acetylmuramic acid 6-phosphate (MurNAc-6-P) etherase